NPGASAWEREKRACEADTGSLTPRRTTTFISTSPALLRRFYCKALQAPLRQPVRYLPRPWDLTCVRHWRRWRLREFLIRANSIKLLCLRILVPIECTNGVFVCNVN